MRCSGPNDLPLQHRLHAVPGQQPFEQIAAALVDGRDRRSSRNCRPVSLLKPTTRSKPSRGRRGESLGELRVEPVIGIGADRREHGLAGRQPSGPRMSEVKMRDVVAARDQDAGQPDAVALQAAFRKKLNDSERDSHRYSARPIVNARSRAECPTASALASEAIPRSRKVAIPSHWPRKALEDRAALINRRYRHAACRS